MNLIGSSRADVLGSNKGEVQEEEKMNVSLTIVQGGKREFERTGIYPEYLLFYFPELKRTWRVKLRNETQRGFLKSKGFNQFEYVYKNGNCKIKSCAAKTFTKIEDALMMMCD